MYTINYNLGECDDYHNVCFKNIIQVQFDNILQ